MILLLLKPFLSFGIMCVIVNTNCVQSFELLIMNDRKEAGGRLFLVKVG